MKVKSSPRLKDPGGTVQVSPSAARQTVRSYSRKKPQSKSQLKILPLSSASSEEDSSVMKTPARKTAELLFDQIRYSTPSHPTDSPNCSHLNSGDPVGAELQISQEQTDDFGGGSSPKKKEVFSSERKRSAPDSGYLSDQTEGPLAHKRGAEPQPEGEESNSFLTAPTKRLNSPLVSEGSPEGPEPPEEEAGLPDEGLNHMLRRRGL
ncbi:uncharacterized protein LOC119897625 [Micropterus salmoides]|uniref:uncharacterized protein LOC119897625 n=1 Tax=Micropterus salmoides TaxID=27706 RepID=UPI0018EBD0D9|nr:uncharacterized protein LOC119897625 [Micropterus salmoides]